VIKVSDVQMSAPLIDHTGAPTVIAPTPQREDDSLTGHLVVLGSGPDAEWDQAMQRLATGGPLLLVDGERPTWQRKYLSSARTANLLNSTEVHEAVRKAAITRQITGVLHFHPAHARAAALVRKELGLPGPDPDTLEATMLRHRTAELLAKAGVNTSGALHADTYDQALEAAHTVGFPLVCKPASPRRRYAARIVADLSALAEAFSAATAATWPSTGTVIEPLLDGIEATAYTLSTASEAHVIAISHTTFDPQAEPAILPAEVVVDADDVCGTAIEDVAARALAAIGHRTGPAQLRLRITATGPVVIGISTHLTDPLLATLIEQVTGVDLITAAGSHARGRPMETEEYRVGAAAVRYLQGPRAVRLMPSSAPAETNITPYARLTQYAVPRRVGPLRRAGHLLVSGFDFPQCTARLRTAAAAVRDALATDQHERLSRPLTG
jgi:biotin carboxylase